jgi:hypothetical protein
MNTGENKCNVSVVLEKLDVTLSNDVVTRKEVMVILKPVICRLTERLSAFPAASRKMALAASSDLQTMRLCMASCVC